MVKWFFSGLFFLLLSSFFLPLSLICTGIILDHKVTRSRRNKERKNKINKINPSSAIGVANAEIRAMYGNKKKVLQGPHSPFTISRICALSLLIKFTPRYHYLFHLALIKINQVRVDYTERQLIKNQT